MADSELFRLSDIAEIARVPSSTVRHYTDLGILRVAGYTEGGHRLYSKSESLQRIAKVQALSKRGFSLPEIKDRITGRNAARKALLVDDDKEVGEFLAEVFKLHFQSWTVRLVTDGFAAGKALLEFYPDLVILDLMLPGIDGFAVCKEIRSDPNLGGTRVLAITGYDSADMKARILSCGADDYLAKPMDVGVLVGKIRMLGEREDTR